MMFVKQNSQGMRFFPERVISLFFFLSKSALENKGAAIMAHGDSSGMVQGEEYIVFFCYYENTIYNNGGAERKSQTKLFFHLGFKHSFAAYHNSFVSKQLIDKFT